MPPPSGKREKEARTKREGRLTEPERGCGIGENWARDAKRRCPRAALLALQSARSCREGKGILGGGEHAQHVGAEWPAAMATTPVCGCDGIATSFPTLRRHGLAQV